VQVKRIVFKLLHSHQLRASSTPSSILSVPGQLLHPHQHVHLLLHLLFQPQTPVPYPILFTFVPVTLTGSALIAYI
jgi:hypothetical protein